MVETLAAITFFGAMACAAFGAHESAWIYTALCALCVAEVHLSRIKK